MLIPPVPVVGLPSQPFEAWADDDGGGTGAAQGQGLVLPVRGSTSYSAPSLNSHSPSRNSPISITPKRFLRVTKRPPRGIWERVGDAVALLAVSSDSAVAAAAEYRVVAVPDSGRGGWVLSAAATEAEARADLRDLRTRLDGLPNGASFKDTIKRLEKTLPWGHGRDPAAALISTRVPALKDEPVLISQAAFRHATAGAAAGTGPVEGKLVVTSAHVVFLPKDTSRQPLVVPVDRVSDVAETLVTEAGVSVPALWFSTGDAEHAFTMGNRKRVGALVLELAGSENPAERSLPAVVTGPLIAISSSSRTNGDLSSGILSVASTPLASPNKSASSASLAAVMAGGKDISTELSYSPKLRTTSLASVDAALAARRFRRTFRLPPPEASKSTFHASLWHRGRARSGTLFLSSKYACFASPDVADPEIRIALPLALLTGITLPSPPSRPPGAPLSLGTAMTPFLVLHARGHRKHWLGFASQPERADAEKAIRDAMKGVDIRGIDFKSVGRVGADTRGLVERLEGVEDPSDSASVVSSSAHESVLSLSDLARLDLGMDPSEARKKMLRDVLDVDDTRAEREARENKPIETVPVGLRYLFPVEGQFAPLPPPRGDDPARPLASHSAQRRAVDMQRKWMAYMDSYGRDAGMLLDLPVLRSLLCQGGVPDAYRHSLWLLWAGVWHAPVPKPGYADLVARLATEDPDAAGEIEKDLRRSHPDHPGFKSRAGVDALRRLLSAYALRNPRVGYAQAMNLVAGALLSELPEPDAFALLCAIAERRMPEHYDPAMVGPQVDAEVFPDVLSRFAPRVAKAVVSTGMDAALLATPWFLSLFLSAVELQAGARIMDVFWLEGVVGLWWIATAVLIECEHGIVEAGEWGGVVNVVRSYLASLCDEEEVEEEPIPTLPRTERASSGASLNNGPLANVGGPGGSGGIPPLPPPRRLKIDNLLRTAYTLAPELTSELLDSLRARARVKVLRRAREQARKSKARDLAEASSFSAVEIGLVLDFLEGSEARLSLPPNSLVAGGMWGAGIDLFAGSAAAQLSNESIGIAKFKSLFERSCPWTMRLKGASPSRGLLLEERMFWYAAARSAIETGRVGVDATAAVGLLDCTTRQPLNAKLRLLFDLFDVDADGFLSREDLAVIMEALLSIAARAGAADHEEEDKVMRATTGFLHAALRAGSKGEAALAIAAGNSISSTDLSPQPSFGGLSMSSSSFAQTEDDDDVVSLGRSESPTPSASVSVARAKERGDDFTLAFPEFTLAILGQSALVDYFGSTAWKLGKAADGGPELVKRD